MFFRILPKLRGVHHVAHHFGSEAMQVKMEVNSFMASVLKMDQRQMGSGVDHGLGYADEQEDDF